MKGPVEDPQSEERRSPHRFTYDDFLYELMNIASDVSECRIPLGPGRKRRIELIERLLILLDVGKPKILPVLREVQRQLER